MKWTYFKQGSVVVPLGAGQQIAAVVLWKEIAGLMHFFLAQRAKLYRDISRDAFIVDRIGKKLI